MTVEDRKLDSWRIVYGGEEKKERKREREHVNANREQLCG